MPFTNPVPATQLPAPVQLPSVQAPPLMQPAQQSKPNDLASALAKSGGSGDSSGGSSLGGNGGSSLGGGGGAAGGAKDQAAADKGISTKTQTPDQWQQAGNKQTAAWQAQPHEATKALDTELKSEDQRRLEDERLTNQNAGVLPGLTGGLSAEEAGVTGADDTWFSGGDGDNQYDTSVSDDTYPTEDSSDDGGGDPADGEYGTYGWD